MILRVLAADFMGRSRLRAWGFRLQARLWSTPASRLLRFAGLESGPKPGARSPSSMHRARPLLGPADVRVRLGEDAHVFLERGDEVRHELHRDHDARADRGADDMVGFGF